MLRISLIIGLVLGSIFFLYGTTLADTHTAASCSRDHVLAAITASSDGDTVNIPAGNCTWSSGVSLSGPRTIKGQGSDRTIIRMNVGETTFDSDDTGGWMRFTGIGFYGSQTTGSSGAISLKNGGNFRIDHCRFYPSTWHGVISLKRMPKGLIDHNIFERNDIGSSDYGIAFGSNYGTGNPPNDSCGYTEPCTSASCIACRTSWENWWNNVNNQNTFRPFEGNYIPGTVNAIYVEDNVFNWKGSAIEGNWGSMMDIVVRHNSFTNRDGNNGGVKPGAQHAEIYNNTFENLLSGGGGAAVYFRSSGLFYNNTIKNYDHGGEFAAYYCGFGYCYLSDNPKVLMHEAYIYNNTYEKCSCPYDSSDCWTEWGEGAPERISEGKNYFFRAPKSGDRIYPYTPYTYPHPLTLGDPPPEQERPAKPKTPTIY